MPKISNSPSFFLRTVLAVATVYGVLSGGSVGAQEVDRFLGLVEPVTATQPLTIGVTVVHVQDDFWKGIVYGIADEAKRAGVEVVHVGVAGAYGNVAQQFSQIQTMQSKDAQVLVVGPAAYDGFDPILNAAKKAGRMIVAAGIPLNSQAVDFGVGQDEAAIGKVLAEFLCRDKGSEPAKAIAIPGPAGAEWAQLRTRAFKEAATDCGMSVVEGPVGGTISISYGLSQASDLLQRHADVKYLFTPVTPLSMGAVQAVKQKNLDVGVVGSTLIKEVFPMLEDGRLKGVSTEPGILIGRLIVQYAIRKHEGLPTPGLTADNPGIPYPALLVPNVVLTKENAASYPYALTDIPPADWSIDQATDN